MARDLKDAWSWLDRLIRKVDRLEAGGMLENSSITNGRLRFIGGLLRLDSGARLEVVGTASIEGPLSVKGETVIEGKTTIQGDLFVTKTLDVSATTTLRGIVTLLKDLIIQSPGKITAGTIEIEPSENGGVIKIGSARLWVKGGQFELSASGFQIWTETGAICIGSRLGTYARLTGTEVQWVGLRTVLNVSVAPRTLMLDASNNMVMTRNT